MFDDLNAPPPTGESTPPDGEAAAQVLLVDARRVLEHLLASPPGPAAIAVCAAADQLSLEEDERVLLLRCWTRQSNWVAAREQAAISRVAGPEPMDPRFDEGGSEVAMALHVSSRTADRRVALARDLTGRLTGTLAAMEAGRLAVPHALVAHEELADLPDPVARRIEAAALRRIGDRPPTPGKFRRLLVSLRATIDARAETERHDRMTAERDVSICPDRFGTATLMVTGLEPPEAEFVHSALTRLAAADGATDPEGPGIRAGRADALLSIVEHAATASLPQAPAPSTPPTPTAPSASRARAELQLVMDLPTLLGLRENPAELVGYGPLPAEVARRLALAASSWRRLVTDPLTGDLLDYGRRSYRPPQALVDYLVARYRTCTAPGCMRRADRCDIDHAVPYQRGGATDRVNCGPLCRRHHRLKTLGRFTLTRHPDGSSQWTTPSRCSYPVAPPRQPVGPDPPAP
jgi:hypothetical protein